MHISPLYIVFSVFVWHHPKPLFTVFTASVADIPASHYVRNSTVMAIDELNRTAGSRQADLFKGLLKNERTSAASPFTPHFHCDVTETTV